MERIGLYSNRVCLRTLSDRIYFGKDLSYRYPESREAEISALPMCCVHLERRQEH